MSNLPLSSPIWQRYSALRFFSSPIGLLLLTGAYDFISGLQAFIVATVNQSGQVLNVYAAAAAASLLLHRVALQLLLIVALLLWKGYVRALAVASTLLLLLLAGGLYYYFHHPL